MTVDTTAAPATAPVERVTPIKPSEAIRLGCLIAPVQAFGTYGFGPEACALGAMVLGLGDAKFGYALGDGIGSAWSGRINHVGPCPDGCGFTADADNGHLVEHLNDDHRWSRERIADWLEGLGL